MILRLHGKSKRKINPFFRGAFDKENGQNAAATYKITLVFGNSPKWKTWSRLAEGNRIKIWNCHLHPEDSSQQSWNYLSTVNKVWYKQHQLRQDLLGSGEVEFPLRFNSMKDYFNQFGFSRTQHIVTWFSRCADNQLTVIKHHRASNEKHFMTTFITVIKFKLIFQLSEIFNHKSLTKLSRSFSGANNASPKNILSHDMGKGCSFLFVDYQFRFSSLRKKK